MYFILGSGKTTVLNTISGRQACCSGHVTLNQQRFGKQLRRRLGFVQQQDVFLSNLTLWETLYVSIFNHLYDELKTLQQYSLKRVNDGHN